MVECSQCLPEEMREGGERWRDEAAPQQRRRPGLLSGLLPASESPLKGSTMTPEAVFRTAHKGSGTFSVVSSFEKKKKIAGKAFPARGAAAPPSFCSLYPISCPTVRVLSRCCDKTGRLYVGDLHIRACVFQTGVAKP